MILVKPVEVVIRVVIGVFLATFLLCVILGVEAFVLVAGVLFSLSHKGVIMVL